jgi:NAD(P)-dependent dehydrogenase (short-subunit alcohol dehydrogenase family)
MIVPNLEGKTILITGGTSGIGMESAVDLAGAGAQVVVTCRERGKGDLALQEIRRRSGSTKVDLLVGNFESQESTRELAAEFLAKYPKLHVLVNNAGTAFVKRELTEDDIEKTFAVNHLAPFLLTNLLLDRLVESAPARIVTVSSVEHFNATLDLDDLSFEKGGYQATKAYARSKLGNILFTKELARRLAGKNVTANTLHPGAVATNIWRYAPAYVKPLLAIIKPFLLTPRQGSETSTYLASSPEVEGVTGKYFVKCKERRSSPLSNDESVARKLWDVSARLTRLQPDRTTTA